MPIPDYQSCMLPLLKLAEDGEEHSIREAVNTLSSQFGLTEEEKAALLPSGTQTIIHNRVGWARTYMKKAGLLTDPRKGHFKITERGKNLLSQTLDRIDNSILNQFSEFIEFKTTHKEKISEIKKEENNKDDSFVTPEEAIEYGHQKILANLSEEILTRIKECSPSFFERLVIDLLVAMGYGGSRKEAGQIIGKSGDEGIDGTINEDRLGLDVIYIQAKKWENTVSRPEIQKFAGALMGQKAKKGIFITTSTFTKEALEYAKNLDTKVILIDGEKLAQLMIEHNLGVAIIATYQVKRMDSDYFIEA